MTRKSVSIRLMALALAALVALPLAGCGKKQIENPYEPVTLAQAISGESAHKLFKFELSQPEILSVEGKLALLKENDRIEFLAGDDLNLLNTLDMGFKLGVHREFGSDPEIYLVLEHVIDGPDTSFVTSDEPPVFPSFQPLGSFDRASYEDVAAQAQVLGDASQVKPMLSAWGKKNQRIWMSGKLSRADHEGQIHYFLDNDFGHFLLEGVTPQGALFLKALLKMGGDLEVAGQLGELNRGRALRDTGILANITLSHFVFQETLITNG
jgi:hypothetical protein